MNGHCLSVWMALWKEFCEEEIFEIFDIFSIFFCQISDKSMFQSFFDNFTDDKKWLSWPN